MDSTPTPSLFAYISYRNAPGVLDWLVATGFRLVLRQDAPDGSVTHAEATFGAVTVMVSTADVDADSGADHVVPPLRGQSTGAGLYLGFSSGAEVDSWFSRAVSAGGTAVVEPEDTEWGTRRARVLDPEGREWSAGTYLPGDQS